MGKPILDVTLTTADERSVPARAVFDTGSFYTIVRDDVLPRGALVSRYKTPRYLGTAGRGGKVAMTGEIILVVAIGDKLIRSPAFVSPDLNKDMLIGAETMQAWEISVQNDNGHTRVVVGHDMRDPDLTEVD